MAADLDFVQVASVTVQHGKSGSAVAPPEMVDTPEDFEKNSGGNSVIGLMNEIKGEMTLDMKEAETEEKYSAKDYVRQMKDAVEDRAAAVPQTICAAQCLQACRVARAVAGLPVHGAASTYRCSAERHREWRAASNYSLQVVWEYYQAFA